ncbi:BON domain-containing protein [Pseudanabaena sp. FACHB-2040]|uniref:BON domain-containing protein n=1 Tax=Pseudanabaena sp. FACHB-2040 TaxID=2692859 RepID=UPI001684E268|nr:BON domain-containing protein [Pseudanabaena sp. FACHB-2040]MBD2256349.1 BON domain-containing protein [Pseudanabaena sp. FACHB-2040]
MLNPFDVLVLMLFAAAAAYLANISARRARVELAAVALSVIMMLSASLPAQAAAAAKDSAISSDQRALNGALQETPNGNQFHGIEYPEVDGTPLSDTEIERRIRANVSDEIATSVSNGAVRISGEVKNRRVAQRIVDEIKDIPGVHELTFDLGLTEINTARQP